MQVVALDRRCAGAAAQFADNFGGYADIGTMNGKFPKGKLPLVVAAAVATAALERHGRTGTIGHERSVAVSLKRPFERLLHSGTRNTAYGSTSTKATFESSKTNGRRALYFYPLS